MAIAYHRYLFVQVNLKTLIESVGHAFQDPVFHLLREQLDRLLGYL